MSLTPHIRCSIYEYETIYDNRFAHNGFVGFGGSAGNLNGSAPVTRCQALSTAVVRGGMGLNIDINFGLGYYFITRTRDNPLYLGIGLRKIYWGDYLLAICLL